MQQESCTTWSAWSRSPPCISSCRVAGGNIDSFMVYRQVFEDPLVSCCCRCSGLTLRTGSSTRWQQPGRPAWRVQLTSKSSSQSSSTYRNSCRTWMVCCSTTIEQLRLVCCCVGFSVLFFFVFVCLFCRRTYCITTAWLLQASTWAICRYLRTQWQMLCCLAGQHQGKISSQNTEKPWWANTNIQREKKTTT